MAITEKDLSAPFRERLRRMLGTLDLGKCFECGTCAAVCPVSRTRPGFDPRKIIHMAKWGLKDRLLASPSLWSCSSCDTCTWACPQEVRIPSLVHCLRETALGEGFLPKESFHPRAAAPCKAACPAHISIPGFIGAIVEGRFADGLRLIREHMPFPGICGRICPHPCETACTRGRADKPVAVEFLKRFLADLSFPLRDLPRKKAGKSRKVAVVGSGPAGLTAAYYLALEGYPVTVFERYPVAGGMMAVAIPEFRLPRSVLEGEVDVVRRLGVEIRLNTEVGRDLPLSDLRGTFDAVFLAPGCHASHRLGIPGETDFAGVVDGLFFLREICLGSRPAPGRRAVVIGGGNAAIDCSRVAKRLGYPSVAILYRRTREEMPAHEWEIRECLEEGIEIQFLTAPVRIWGEEGRVVGLECLRMRPGDPDASGRRRPIPVDGSELKVQADLVLKAIGQGPDLRGIAEDPALPTTAQGLIAADPACGATAVPGVFAGGDAVSGPRTVVDAVAAGKAAARAMDRYLKGEASARGPNWEGVPGPLTGWEPVQREPMPRLPLHERRRSFREVDLGYSPGQAKSEASRCIRICGTQE